MSDYRPTSISNILKTPILPLKSRQYITKTLVEGNQVAINCHQDI